MGRIIVGVDESETAAEALRWATRQGAVRGWSTTALLAWGYLDQHHGSPGSPFDPEYGQAEARVALDRLVEQILGVEHEPVERRVVNDLPARALLEAAESDAGAELLVVGGRGVGGFRGLLLGSVSRRVLYHATRPVAVIRAGQADSSADRVVVGVDGSERARHALRWAIADATDRRATLTVLHAWLPPLAVMPGYIPTPAVDFDALADRAGTVVDAALAAVDLSTLAHPVDRRLVCDGAAAALIDAAQGAALVVVGARGLGGMKGAVLGSVSQQVSQHAPCPAVVIPTD